MCNRWLLMNFPHANLVLDWVPGVDYWMHHLLTWGWLSSLDPRNGSHYVMNLSAELGDQAQLTDCTSQSWYNMTSCLEWSLIVLR